MSGIIGDFCKSSGSVVKTLQFGTLQVTKAGLSIKTPGFSSKVQVNPSFQNPPLLRLPLNQTQHLDVFKINQNLFYINKELSKKFIFYNYENKYYSP